MVQANIFKVVNEEGSSCKRCVILTDDKPDAEIIGIMEVNSRASWLHLKKLVMRHYKMVSLASFNRKKVVA